tara:strand:+ start:129 stop:278 length:150 start_codon:yes stop_codon:yes gene_type:complete
MNKLINFKTLTFVKNIQDYADKHHEGNFSMAIRSLVSNALAASKDSEGK